MQKALLYVVLLLIFVSGCTSVVHLNDFSMRGLPSSTFLPSPVDSTASPHTRISGGVQYSSVNNLGYNDGRHAPVDSNGLFYFKPYEEYGSCSPHGCILETHMKIDPACSLSYQGQNIHWRTPPLFASISAEFAVSAKYSSLPLVQ